MVDFLTPFGGMGWEIPGRRGALLPQAPREKLKAFLGLLSSLSFLEQGVAFSRSRQIREGREKPLTFLWVLEGEVLPSSQGFPTPSLQRGSGSPPSAPPLPTWSAALLQRELGGLPPSGRRLPRRRGERWVDFLTPFGGMGGESLEGGEHFSLRHPEKS